MKNIHFQDVSQIGTPFGPRVLGENPDSTSGRGYWHHLNHFFWTPAVSELPTQDQNWVKIWFWIFRVREIGKTYQEPINS